MDRAADMLRQPSWYTAGGGNRRFDAGTIESLEQVLEVPISARALARGIAVLKRHSERVARSVLSA
jgi:hypothetical protein